MLKQNSKINIIVSSKKRDMMGVSYLAFEFKIGIKGISLVFFVSLGGW